VSARTLATLCLLFGPAVPACDPQSPGEPAATPTRRAGDDAAPPPPAREPRRGRLLAGERVLRVPVWPDASRLARAARERLGPDVRDAIGRSPVPVLAPSDPALLATAAVYSQPAGYALSVRAGELSLVVQASRVATLLPHIGHAPGNTRLRGVDGWVSSNDGVRTASWIEHGTAYSLDLECAAPDGPSCSEPAVRAAVEALVYVGGAGEQGDPR
jgi:hypothetical protein